MIQNKLSLVLLVIFSLSLSNASQAQGAGSAAATRAVDYPAIKKDLDVFRGVVETTVRQNLQGFFPILGSTKWMYLPEYGAIFNLEVNLYQIRRLSPFDMRPHTEKELTDSYNSMMKRLESLKQELVKVLCTHGASLQQVKPSDNLTVVVHIFKQDLGADRPCPSQVILKIKKSTLEEGRQNRRPFEDLAKNVEIIQF
jgi:hypothetical protein